MKVKYFRPNVHETIKDATEISLESDYDLSKKFDREWCAVAIAEHIFNYNGGWEMWRVPGDNDLISIVALDGQVYTLNVGIEFSPGFYASEVENKRTDSGKETL